ncbi:MAG: T9SS type A sorting domain-containing protein [Lewinellaceae bacterium]|nr:T9SS type A sorting domain-containing protein [Lewinellaceae bacterium]
MKILRHFVFLAISLLLANVLPAQGWQRVYADTAGALAFLREAKPTPDGGYIAIGSRNLPTGAIRNYLYLLKTGANGEPQWEYNYREGAIGHDEGVGVALTPDGGYYALGNTSADGWQFSFLLVRLDEMGDTIWSKTYAYQDTLGTTMGAYGLTDDGGLVLAGSVSRPDSTTGVYLLKVDAAGNKQWEKFYGWPGNNPYPALEDIVQLDDGGYIAAGQWDSYQIPRLVRFDAQGDTLWTRAYQASTGDELWAVRPAHGGGFIACGSATGFAGYSALVIRTDDMGNELWQRFYGLNTKATDMELTPDGGYVLAGSLDNYIWYPLATSGFLLRIDGDGNELWQRDFSNPTSGFNRLGSVELTPDGGFIVAGESRWNPFLAKTDGNGYAITNWLQGKVFRDETGNCSFETPEPGLDEWIVRIEGGGLIQYATTDAAGEYSILVDTGDYSLTLLPPNALWTACELSVAVGLPDFYDTTYVDFAASTLADCPLMQVDVSVPFLRRCFDNTYTVQYCNEGTLAAENAAVEVELDPYLSLQSAELPYASLGTNRYRFELGNVPFDTCGRFHFTAYLNCDSTVLGQTHCVEAHILPDTLCFDTVSTMALIETEIRCEGDSLRFTLRNAGGAGMNNPSEYIVIEDDVMYMNAPFELGTGESLQFSRPANGFTYRLEAPRLPDSNSGEYVSSTVEGCGFFPGGGFSTGFVNQFALFPGGPFDDIECRENIGAYDPNDKQALPVGYGESRFIEPGTDIEYHIRFQNTGTDTAFTVVIRDTLSAWLAPASVKPGASSHDYRWALSGENVLTFIFDDIMLPDSNVNEPASHGFVKFLVSQRPGNPLGERIENSAAIYFDFNAPVITNTAFHTLGEDFIKVVNEANPGAGPARVRVLAYPNPFTEQATLVVEGLKIGDGTFLLYHTDGRLARRLPFRGQQFELYADGLPAGMYFFQVMANRKLVGSGKVVVGE